MKTTTMMMITIAALLSVFSLSAWTGNQMELAQPGVITVTGEAEIRVVPDEVILTLGVETWDKYRCPGKFFPSVSCCVFRGA